MTEYLKRDIARILEKRPATIEYYTSSGLVVPDIEPSQGRGKPRVYSQRNLIEFGMIDIMSSMGASLNTSRRVLDILREGKFMPDGYTEMLIEGPLEEVNKWKKKNTISFDDFWKSDKWGVTKELVFINVRGLSESGEVAYEEWVEILEKTTTAKGLLVDKTFDPRASFVSILWLGSIKKEAIKMVLK